MAHRDMVRRRMMVVAKGAKRTSQSQIYRAFFSVTGDADDHSSGVANSRDIDVANSRDIDSGSSPLSANALCTRHLPRAWPARKTKSATPFAAAITPTF